VDSEPYLLFYYYFSLILSFIFLFYINSLISFLFSLLSTAANITPKLKKSSNPRPSSSLLSLHRWQPASPRDPRPAAGCPPAAAAPQGCYPSNSRSLHWGPLLQPPGSPGGGSPSSGQQGAPAAGPPLFRPAGARNRRPPSLFGQRQPPGGGLLLSGVRGSRGPGEAPLPSLSAASRGWLRPLRPAEVPRGPPSLL